MMNRTTLKFNAFTFICTVVCQLLEVIQDNHNSEIHRDSLNPNNLGLRNQTVTTYQTKKNDKILLNQLNTS